MYLIQKLRRQAVQRSRNSILSRLSFALIAIAASMGCQSEKTDGRYGGGIVRVAVTPTSPPFSYANPTNLEEMTGLEVDLIKAVMDRAGLKVEWIVGKWSALLPTIFSGASDVMVANVNYREDRAKRGDFVVYMISGQSVVVPRGNPKKVRSEADLCGLTSVQVIGGSSFLAAQKISEKCVSSGKKALVVQGAEDQEAAFRQLANGRVDAVVDGAASAGARLAKDGGREFNIAFTIVSDIPAGAIVRNDNVAMRQILYDGIAAMQKDGSLAAIFRKYGVDPALIIPAEIRT